MTMVMDLKINAGIVMMKVSNVKRNSKIGVSTIKTESHVAPKKLDLVDEWVNAGYVDQSPYVNYITMFDKSKKHDYWDLLKKNEWAMGPAEIYHLDGKKYSGESKTRWNFECPTHHPMPKVAIILGCFIPVMFILLVIVLVIVMIQFLRQRNAQPAKEEEAAVDEIPPSAE